ncbi:MAG: hypothetical protein IKQ20_05900 [Bacteroidales bacterium]|nr:hypothetical protein [Bacteroidales bacterium]
MNFATSITNPRKAAMNAPRCVFVAVSDTVMCILGVGFKLFVTVGEGIAKA